MMMFMAQDGHDRADTAQIEKPDSKEDISEMALRKALEICKESIRATAQLIDISKPSLPLGGSQYSFIGHQNHAFNSLKICVCDSLQGGPSMIPTRTISGVAFRGTETETLRLEGGHRETSGFDRFTDRFVVGDSPSLRGSARQPGLSGQFTPGKIRQKNHPSCRPRGLGRKDGRERPGQ
jgi:hypothetical protein